MMTLDDFSKRFCALCGSIQCGGIDDEIRREGCEHYKLVYPYGEDTTICGEDGCDGCFLQHADRLDLCRERGKVKLGKILGEQE